MGRDGTYITGLDAVRFAAACAVVAIHSFMEYEHALDSYVIRMLTRWAVPFFFTISGYFMKEELKSFARYWLGILGQYVVWTVFYALMDHLDIWSVRNFLSGLRSGIIMPFWYFPSLLLCLAFVWALNRVIKDRRIVLIICSLLFVVAIMGHTLIRLPAFSFFQESIIMRIHHRIIGEVTTRDGIFWGSFWIALGGFLKDRDEIWPAAMKKSMRICCGMLFVLLYLLEIWAIVRFDTGEKDITLFTIPLVIMLFDLGRRGQLQKRVGETLRYTGNYMFLTHYFFLEFFMNKGLRSVPLFGATLLSAFILSFLISALLMAVSRRKSLPAA